MTNEDLCVAYKNGDKNALNELIKNNMGFIRKLAMRLYSKYGNYTSFDYDDFIQLSSIGLMKAARKFDINKGFKFITYAAILMSHTIQTGIKDDSRSVIHIPHIYFKLASKLYDYGINRKNINEDELIKRFIKDNPEYNMNQIYRCKKYTSSYTKDLSFDDKSNTRRDHCNDDGSLSIRDTLSSDYNVEDDVILKLTLLEINNIVTKEFNKRDRNIIHAWLSARDDKDKNQTTIGKLFNVSQAYVSRILKRYRLLVIQKLTNNKISA